MAMVLVASVKVARSWVPKRTCFSTLASRNYRQQLDLAREPCIQSPVRLFGSSGNVGDSTVNEKNENNKKKKPEIWRALQTQSLAPLFPSSDEYTFPSPIDDMLTDLPVGQRVVCFGDVHGDIEALCGFLVTAKVMDPKSSAADPKWIGGDTICVQTGDILDRGDDELACLRVLASLARQAKDAGGSLTVLYGNHESLNAAGMFHYTNPGGNQEIETDIGYTVDSTLGTDRWRLQFAGNQPARWAAFEPGGLFSQNLLANMKIACVVGRTCFVHAGLTDKHLTQYGSITQMNKAARDWILKREFQFFLDAYLFPSSDLRRLCD
jgi:hypothetical protein